MENTPKEEGKCGSGCGLKCGCCVCKAVKCLVLLLVGGVIGYFVGRGCALKSHACAVPHAHEASAPAAAPKKK